MKFEVSELYVYPIKSLGKIKLEKAKLSETGIEYDRNWMLISEGGNPLTQRDEPRLALFRVSFSSKGVRVSYRDNAVEIPYAPPQNEATLHTNIWGTDVLAQKDHLEASTWFSDMLNQKIELVRVSPEVPRWVKRHPSTKVNFSDSNQILLLGQESLNGLNAKLETDINIDRFRANIIFTGGTPHVEDNWAKIAIGNASFEITKSCARCTMTTIDQETATKGKEPLRTLSTYRAFENKVLFGRYLKYMGAQENINVGDELKIMG